MTYSWDSCHTADSRPVLPSVMSAPDVFRQMADLQEGDRSPRTFQRQIRFSPADDPTASALSDETTSEQSDGRPSSDLETESIASDRVLRRRRRRPGLAWRHTTATTGRVWRRDADPDNTVDHWFDMRPFSPTRVRQLDRQILLEDLRNNRVYDPRSRPSTQISPAVSFGAQSDDGASSAAPSSVADEDAAPDARIRPGQPMRPTWGLYELPRRSLADEATVPNNEDLDLSQIRLPADRAARRRLLRADSESTSGGSGGDPASVPATHFNTMTSAQAAPPSGLQYPPGYQPTSRPGSTSCSSASSPRSTPSHASSRNGPFQAPE